MVLPNGVNVKFLLTFVNFGTCIGRTYGVNSTDYITETLDIFPTGGLKDDYERKFYIAGVAILTVFVLFMVYGALHEVDEDIIDYDARRQRKKEKKRRRRERKRLAKPHPCERGIYDVTASANELLCSLRSQYGCKCLCTCEFHQLHRLNQVQRWQNEPMTHTVQCEAHSQNNNSEARILYQSSDPANRVDPLGDGEEVWLKRQSYLQANSEFSLFYSCECMTGIVPQGDENTDLHIETHDASQSNSVSRKKSSGDVNLMTFPSVEESHIARVASPNVSEYRPVTEGFEEVWQKRTSQNSND